MMYSIYHLLSAPLFLPLGGTQQEIIRSKIPMRDLAPNTPTLTEISVTGEMHYVMSGCLM